MIAVTLKSVAMNAAPAQPPSGVIIGQGRGAGALLKAP
jgi:hypothetical protein